MNAKEVMRSPDEVDNSKLANAVWGYKRLKDTTEGAKNKMCFISF
jgi:hypothetical protein